jgi:hypothetical protein
VKLGVQVEENSKMANRKVMCEIQVLEYSGSTTNLTVLCSKCGKEECQPCQFGNLQTRKNSRLAPDTAVYKNQPAWWRTYGFRRQDLWLKCVQCVSFLQETRGQACYIRKDVTEELKLGGIVALTADFQKISLHSIASCMLLMFCCVLLE